MNGLKIASIALMVLGIMLLSVGFMFRTMHLIDATCGLYSGPIVFVIGIILLFISRRKK
jgi:membrane-bound ClpP family serine protease